MDVSNLVDIGIVEAVRYEPIPLARVRIGERITGWFRMGTARAGGDKTWSVYEVGEEVLVVSIQGRMQHGVIVCALNNGAHPAPASSPDVHRVTFGNGAVVDHDRASGALSVSAKGPITVNTDGPVTVSAPSVSITAPGDVTITGDVIVNGDVVADGISLKTHVHSGVVPGPSLTGGPQ